MDKMTRKTVTAIILAGGSGSRMKSTTTKQRLCICGESVLFRSVKCFATSDVIDSIIVVCRYDEIEWAREELALFDKVVAIVPGGKTRAESANAGFKAITDQCDYVAIHDAARCLVSHQNIRDVIEMAFVYGAATACTACTDTLKAVSDEKLIDRTIPREGLFVAQTPQAFEYDLYGRAIFESVRDESITDDNMAVERLGHKIYPVETGRSNIKITNPDDIAFAEFLIERTTKMPEYRVGHGYDVHRLADDRKLIVGGVTIPFDKGLLGHSDADVLTHAIMDALLGAAGLGDIGRHFPDNDEEYRGISSLQLLSRVGNLLAQDGASIINIDATIVAQRPKMMPYVDEMKNNIANILRIESGRINIKATTEEGLGFTGTGEGISSFAVVTIKK